MSVMKQHESLRLGPSGQRSITLGIESFHLNKGPRRLLETGTRDIDKVVVWIAGIEHGGARDAGISHLDL
jgi:hypothetical protein